MSKMNKVLAIAAAVAAASCVGVCCVPVLAAGCFFRIRPCVFTLFIRLRQFDAFVERFFESVVFHSFFSSLSGAAFMASMGKTPRISSCGI